MAEYLIIYFVMLYIYMHNSKYHAMMGGHPPEPGPKAAGADDQVAAAKIKKGVEDLMSLTLRPLGVTNIKTLDIRKRLALSARVAAAHGVGGGMAGQFTARGPKPNTMWTQRFGLALDELTPSDFLLVDDKLNVLEGEGIPNPANIFQIAVYNKRKDVQSIIHTHPLYCSALSMRGEPLVVAHMDAMPLYGDCGWLKEWPGIPFEYDEGEIISTALGDKKAALLANHGQISTGSSPEDAAFIAITFEHAAKLQILSCGSSNATAKSAESENKPRIPPVDVGYGQAAHDFFNSEGVVLSLWCYYARDAIQKYPDITSTSVFGKTFKHVYLENTITPDTPVPTDSPNTTTDTLNVSGNLSGSYTDNLSTSPEQGTILHDIEAKLGGKRKYSRSKKKKRSNKLSHKKNIKNLK